MLQDSVPMPVRPTFQKLHSKDNAYLDAFRTTLTNHLAALAPVDPGDTAAAGIPPQETVPQLLRLGPGPARLQAEAATLEERMVPSPTLPKKPTWR